MQTDKAINEEIIRFYKHLLGSNANSLPAINPTVVKDEPCLTRDMQLPLIELVSWLKVQDALEDIDDQMAPGCDGFNALFFKRER